MAVWSQPVTICSYEPMTPSPYPEYLDRRVYQGSSGRIYPLPFIERIEQQPRPRQFEAIHLANRYVRVMILPQLGGRIHVGRDLSNGYDFFYLNNVIKPALVGLQGPWMSGGVEFNWPQHHRPATWLPVSTAITREEDGSATVWCSDHDPFARMKGMHGVCLHPDSAIVEARVRLFNRTEDVQTFLWWANVAAHVGDHYQSFFPTDVHAVADHAKRATMTFPQATGKYYGVDYPARVDAEHPDADRLDFYRNIPVPTSYMCLGSQDDFFGGYDHGREAGFVHVADHTISPGKKQWTWGNAPFGWAWDRNLTDSDGPYVELMAGVYTDNQPDFSFLAPGEVKAFSQYWYPIEKIGTVQQANLECAIHLEIEDGGRHPTARVGVAVTHASPGLTVELISGDGVTIWTSSSDLDVAQPLVADVPLPSGTGTLTLQVRRGASVVLEYTPRPTSNPCDADLPSPATEPPRPTDIASNDELYITGLHLRQYRHATRSPMLYWDEALRRDPLDMRVNTAVGAELERAGRHEQAVDHFRRAITRATLRNPNPYDAEAYYRLGLALTHLGRDDEAYEALAKAGWSAAWRGPAALEMAAIDARAGRYERATVNVSQSLMHGAENARAIALAVVVSRRLGDTRLVAVADEGLAEALRRDPLDQWLLALDGRALACDAGVMLDVALEFAWAGEDAVALDVLGRAADLVASDPAGMTNEAPLIAYHRADILARLGRDAEASDAHSVALAVDATRAFPGRVADADMLGRIVARYPDDARARAMLGHWLYAVGRHDDAIASWNASVAIVDDPVVWRNLGIASYNVLHDPEQAVRCYEKALALQPGDAKLVHERDQLARRMGAGVAERLTFLEAHRDVIEDRDDLTCDYAELLVMDGRASEALQVLQGRQFQPWEGGEGRVLSLWEFTNLTLGRQAMAAGDQATAVAYARQAIDTPQSLGEARHMLANCADLYLFLGDALDASGDHAGAASAWQTAADFQGDFQQMATMTASDVTYYSVLAARRLGSTDVGDGLTGRLREFLNHLDTTTPEVDYFATSLPAMLLFQSDLVKEQQITRAIVAGQIALLDDDATAAGQALQTALDLDPGNARAWAISQEADKHEWPKSGKFAGARLRKGAKEENL